MSKRKRSEAEAEVKQPKETKAKKPKKEHKKVPVVEDPTPYLGRIFRDCPPYREALYLRIIGWTKSKKTVLLEAVPLTAQGLVDRKWLDEHPIVKPLQKAIAAPDGTAILRPAEKLSDDKDDGILGLHFTQNGGCDTFVLCSEEDLKQAHSFCEY
jgi:hypothetical protein